MTSSIALSLVIFQFAAFPKSSVFSAVYFMQAVAIIPLIGFNMGSKIEGLTSLLEFAFYNFSFLPDEIAFTGGSSTSPRALYLDQERDYLVMIGLEGGSAFFNLAKLFFVLTLILIIYAIVAIAYMTTKRNNPEG